MSTSTIHRRKPRNCEVCSTSYVPTYGGQRTCGRQCGVLINSRTKCPSAKVWFKSCIECGETFTARRQAVGICSDECRRVRRNRCTSSVIKNRYRLDPAFRDKVLAATHSRRADKLGLGQANVTISYLGDRDNWTCGICHHHIASPKQASIDHIVPLSKGGTHALDNVHISHRLCNYAKGNRGGGEQLILVG